MGGSDEVDRPAVGGSDEADRPRKKKNYPRKKLGPQLGTGDLSIAAREANTMKSYYNGRSHYNYKGKIRFENLGFWFSTLSSS